MAKKILFLNPSVRDYRVPFYDLLNQEYDVKFLFYHSDYWIKDKFPEMKRWNYQILREYRFFGYTRGFTPHLIWKFFTEDYDVAINQDVFSFASHVGFLITKLRGKKWISWEEMWIYPKNKLARIIYPYHKFILNHSDACVAAGSKAKILLEKVGVKQNKIFIGPNSAKNLVNLAQEEKISVIKQKYDLNDKIVFSFVGRIMDAKGVDILINAFNKLNSEKNNLKLLIIGYSDKDNTEYFNKCKKLAHKNQDIIFVGRQEAGNLANHLCASDIFVLPSKFAFEIADCTESWGMVVNEAMSCSKAILASTAAGSTYDLVKEGVNGFIFKENSEIELVNVMEKILLSDYKAFGIESKNIITNHFNYNEMLRGFKKAITFAINKK